MTDVLEQVITLPVSYEISTIDRAAYDTVHQFPGGAAALAERANLRNGKTLSNLVKPDNPAHKLGLKQSIPIQIAADDYRILHAYNAALNHVAIRLPDVSSYSDMGLLDAYAAWTADIGQTAEAIRQALDAGVTEDELATIYREMHEDFARAYELFARLKTIMKPSHGAKP